MAPRKKQQQQPKQKQNNRKSNTSSSTSDPRPSSSGPKLNISAENETRLRRLLLSSGRSTPSVNSADDSLSKVQKVKKLKAVYENLSCEGFTNDQIELALSTIGDGATFEAALDWLCLNLPSSELPLKFSSGTSLHTHEGGSVRILHTAQKDCPSMGVQSSKDKDRDKDVPVILNRRKDDDKLDLFQSSQAEWIKQYVEQQEEDDYGTWEDDMADEVSSKEASQARSYDVIAEEYYAARLEAAKAKEEGDKKRQETAGNIIRKLKQELFAQGLSVDMLASEFEYGRSLDNALKDEPMSSMQDGNVGVNQADNVGSSLDFSMNRNESVDVDGRDWSTAKEMPVDLMSSQENESTVDVDGRDCSISKEISVDLLSSQGKNDSEELEDVEIGNFFLEDVETNSDVAQELLNLKKKEKMRELSSGKNLEKLDGIWKKGDPLKIPKAVLHQLCQREGWDAPKFNKIHRKENRFFYAVNVLRKASGRGKNRKAGGLITLQFPNEDEIFESAEDAQNKVAAFALCHLFPDLPVHLALVEPYASLVMQWKAGESISKVDDEEKDRRASFVDSLLDASNFGSASKTLVGKVEQLNIEDDKKQPVLDLNSHSFMERLNHNPQNESSHLRREHENKMKTKKYQEMLKNRNALPIASLRGDILRLLKENNVLVVCGDTGSGKTTQVPQFILDEMIESGCGGQCNIVCTQPRRIAAISVAERVSDERCEPAPGSNGSLIGYHVRLDSARNENTKLLFCTTGILLRQIGDETLTGVTHIIVDEVHERSLLGDFLLVVLKNLIKKRSVESSSPLKVILMSATVDSNLFSGYFGNCPVITAEGRTHPVTTYFLEDIYESTGYHLASDSPAAIRYEVSSGKKSAPVNSRRGKKNLILSGWGDDALLSEACTNPHYNSDCYQSYSELTHKNLERLNEHVIDYDLLEDLVIHVDKAFDEGAILVFLPGVSEIHLLYDRLAASYQFGGQASDWILPLHSSIASTDQKKVFLRPPYGIRKVIIATNIAETSITIDDVVYVIDSGRHKENRYNPQKKLSSMVEDWISQANARQRRGRAGRVRPGTCFCLYTRHRYENLMRPFQVPEMHRMPLVELCLQIKLLSLGYIRPFLSKALEPPREEAMASAISSLYEVGALEGNEELTPLGQHLAKLPVDVLIGKMMLYGGIFGCLSSILSISAFLSYKSPFVYPKDEKQNVERAKLALLTDDGHGLGESCGNDKQSDHLIMVTAYKKWEKILHQKGARAAQQFCRSYFLSSSVMYMIRDMRVQFGTLLADTGLVDLPKKSCFDRIRKEDLDGWFSDSSQPFNVNSDHPSIVKAVLCAGLYPNIAAGEEGISEAALSSLGRSSGPATTARPVLYDGRREVYIHPSSVNSNLKAFQYPFHAFLEKVETNKVFIRDTSVVSPYSILLFGGSINIQHQSGIVIIDGWLKLTAPAQIAVLFKELRLTLHSILKELIKKPETNIIIKNEVLKSIVRLLLEEDKSLT
ncbi:DExH-box ATP-dependent RNA helicase DExH7, chloroplastic isoform X2 [Benincasa hispida]|uniref:DExH-box ATP-dependent RNA helicase DExH7, chloroplastic isoform X2 n=1 Tax=Benincasa hispida TaxID=102211 RepID=UPI0018FFFEF5|nr:DExH-box ATP-dependent RNA helicase DExH7, chloroplastic isoform X2 [Benincasa hispida]